MVIVTKFVVNGKSVVGVLIKVQQITEWNHGTGH